MASVVDGGDLVLSEAPPASRFGFLSCARLLLEAAALTAHDDEASPSNGRFATRAITAYAADCLIVCVSSCRPWR
jgi:hypothetical protein